MVSALPLPLGDPLPADSTDECIPPKKRGTWHSDLQPVTFIPPKKRRIWYNVQHPEVQSIDWISAMPDDILVKILSLVTIREAAMTDCLSSRWRHLWENVHRLSLNARALGMQVLANSKYHENPDLWNSEATKFVHKVNELLRHHNGCGVQKFDVQFPLTSAHAPDLDRWVAFSATSGAKSLRLCLCDVDAMPAIQHVEPYSLPLKHFTDVVSCKLHNLCLSNCSLETVDANLSGFSYLDCIVLDSVSVVDAVVLNIMSSCSALRLMGLRKCHQLINLRASHPQLVRMEVYDCKSLISISIHAEKLMDFTYKGHKVDVQYEYAPVVHRLSAHFVKKSECPLECIGAHSKLRSLTLQFPSRLQNPDRISSLPDDILIKILSLMTVREAAVTDVLSTRWRHLWESVDHLILDLHAFGTQMCPSSDWNSVATKFVCKVNELLSHYKGNKLKEFKVEFPLSSAHASDLDRWVAFAVASHAETLTLSLATDGTGAYVFPLKQFFYVRGCQLHVLSLCKCILETVPANLNGFSCLYSLSLCHVRVVDEVLLSIMSSCNALCYLYLISCHELIDLRVSHAQLVGLEVHYCRTLSSISIHAEKMERFSYKGKRVDIEYECAPVLCELSAYFIEWEWNASPLDFLDRFPNKLKMLALQFPSCLQVSRVLQHNRMFAVLKEITLGILTPWKKSIRIVALVLQAAPSVETLNLEVREKLRPLKMLKIRWPKNFTAASLKTVRIGGFSGESELVQLLLFLLRRSPMLKTLIIDTQQVSHFALLLFSMRSQDAMRRNYGREVAQTHVAPNVPSTVKLNIM